jgi:HlyD family secretion protein
MSSRKKLLIVAGAVIAIGALGALSMRGGREKGVEVRTEQVARRDLVSLVTASGKIEPVRKVDISADISGRVVQVLVQEGQTVSRGDLLIRIDPSAFQANVRRAEASVSQARAREAQARSQLAQSRSALERAEQLSTGDQLISRAELDQARTQAQVAEGELQAARFGVSQADAALSEARDQLSKTTIAAPMAGRVTRLNIEEGETAVVGTMNNPGSLLLTIADLSTMQATVKVDETDVPGITVGDSAAVRIDAFPGQSFPGRVTRIGNSSIQPTAGVQVNEETVDYEVEITLDSPPAELRPDLSATAEIVTETRGNALAVPIIALTVRDPEGKKLRAADDEENQAPGQAQNGSRTARAQQRAQEVEGVFVVRDGKAVFVPVEVGIAGDRYFEVIKGLNGGETVVSGTYQVIRELESDAAVRQPEPEKGKARGDSAGGK